MSQIVNAFVDNILKVWNFLIGINSNILLFCIFWPLIFVIFGIFSRSVRSDSTRL